MMEGIKARPFRREEVEDLRELIYYTIDTSYSGVYPTSAIEFFKDYHDNAHILDDYAKGYTIVVEYAGEIIATGTLLGDDIRRVFVNPKYQKQGLGRFIMELLEKKAAENGLTEVGLSSSVTAKRLYDSMGYFVKEECCEVFENGEKLPYFEMGKKLSLYNFHNKKFKVVKNDGPGAEVNEETYFYFKQDGNVVHADYYGGGVKVGKFIGIINGDEIEFRYVQVNRWNEFNSGKSKDRIQFTDKGKLQLIDRWKWETKEGEGLCILEEV